MNRSFMGAREQPAPARGRTLGAVIKEKDEELALFLEMRRREKEKERSNNLLLPHNSDDHLLLDPPPGSKLGSAPIFKIVSTTPARKAGIDDFLNSDSDKNDYDWLLTPPGTPLFPSLEEAELKKSPVSHIGTPKSRPTALKSRLANPPEPSSKGCFVPRTSSSSSLNSAGSSRRPLSSGGRTSSRPATPTGQPTLATTSKPSRSSTPTSRPTVPAKTVPAPARSSTPAARSSTPSSRASIPVQNRPTARSSTPTRRPTPSSQPASSAPPGRSSSVTKSAPTASKASVPSRGASPSVRSRPWKPSDIPGFSLDAPPNLRTSLPERPSSASRGRPAAPTSRSSSVEAGPNPRPRRLSCSPSRGRAPNGNAPSSSSVPAVRRSQINGSDSVNPVVIGNKMVERVVNMRRLAPPKQDDPRSNRTNIPGTSSLSPDSAGFGRTLSKKSLDMALRHMDIRRSIPNNLRPLMTNIPASSMYSVRSGPTRSRGMSISGSSPHATSSNASSERSVGNNMLSVDGTEAEDDFSRSFPVGQLSR